MARYAIAFDMDTTAMKNDGVTDSQRTSIYQNEITSALAACGFTAHAQGSLYHTEADTDGIASIMKLQDTLKMKAPNFCKYAKRIHVFRMEEWSEVTELITGRKSDQGEIVDFEC